MSGRYDDSEFNTIKYMATSGGISIPESDQRIAYYGVSGYPTLVWQGTIYNVGAGTDVIDGAPYDAIVQSLLPSATPVKLSINDYSFSDPAFVTIDVELENDLDDITQTYIRAYLVEDNLRYGTTFYNDVLRDMLPQQALTIDTAGQTQQLTIDFAWDPSALGWVAEEMRIVVMVQDDRDKSVLQSCNSHPTPDYAFRYYSLGERVVIDQGEHEFGEFALFNVGLAADTYSLSLDTSALPGGWNAWFTDGVDTYTSLDVALDPGARSAYTVIIAAAGDGSGKVILNMHSQQNRTDDRRVSYQLIQTEAPILLVDDDGAESYEADYFGPALETTDYDYVVWDRGEAALTAPILANFDVVVWNVGWAFPTLTETDRAALGAYLDNGGNLFISGQDIGWELNDIGGTAYAWYRQYLHATYINDDTNNYTLTGTPGDPIGDGIDLVIQGGDGANNQDYPSDIDPYGQGATVIFAYDASRNGAIKAAAPNHKVVYFAFGYEAINNAADRELVMQRIITWLLSDVTDVPGRQAGSMVLHPNVPNPFNPITKISFELGRPAAIRLEIFDVAGRLVRLLENKKFPAGQHLSVWDGKDDGGRLLSSGTYFYRLDDGEQKLSHKMLMLK